MVTQALPPLAFAHFHYKKSDMVSLLLFSKLHCMQPKSEQLTKFYTYCI